MTSSVCRTPTPFFRRRYIARTATEVLAPRGQWTRIFLRFLTCVGEGSCPIQEKISRVYNRKNLRNTLAHPLRLMEGWACSRKLLDVSFRESLVGVNAVSQSKASLLHGSTCRRIERPARTCREGKHSSVYARDDAIRQAVCRWDTRAEFIAV